MKFELPPPIPLKRRIPPKQGLQEPQGAPIVQNAPSTQLSPAGNASKPSPEVDVSNNLEGIAQQELPPRTRRLSDTGATSSSESSAPTQSKRSTPILVPFLLAGGFAAFVAGLTIVAIKNTSPPPAQTQSSNSGSYSAPMTETPAGTAPAVAEPPTWEQIKTTAEYQQLDPNQRLAAFHQWHNAVLNYAATLQGYNDVIRQEFEGRIANEQQALENAAAQWYNEQHSALQQVPGTRSAKSVSTPESLSVLSPSVEESPTRTYHVSKVNRHDSLKVRTGPAQTYPAVVTLAPGTRGISLLSGRIANGPTTWQEISVGGYTGWVNDIYLEADSPRAVPPAAKVH